VGSASSIKLIGGSLDFVTPSGTALNITDGNLSTGGYVSFTNNSSTNAINRALGSGGSIGISWLSKGTGSHNFATNNSAGTQQMVISHTASAVNYVQVTGAATGGNPTISTQGSDANISLRFQTKGTFGVGYLNSAGGLISSITHATTTSSTNYIALQAVQTGSSPAVAANGTDPNIDLTLTPKGTGAVRTANTFQAGLISGGTF
jgi:hypothetical protein